MEYVFTVGYMPDGSSTFTIKIKDNPVLESFLFLSVPDSGSAEYWLHDLDSVLEGAEPSLTRYGETHNVKINPDHTVIKQASSETIQLDTHTLRDLIATWSKTMEDFRSHRKEQSTWHGIPTWLSPEEASDSQNREFRYWNPTSNKTGYFKDTQEGKVWAETTTRQEGA